MNKNQHQQMCLYLGKIYMQMSIEKASAVQSDCSELVKCILRYIVICVISYLNYSL